jgi:hypothetical protein
MTANPITTSLTAIIEACYDDVTFEPGGGPSWERFRSLFLPEALLTLRLFPGDPEITVMDLDTYMVRQMREGMKEAGYSETIVHRRDLVYRNIAETRVIFHMKFGDTAPYTALNIFQLIHKGGRWWIVSVTSDILEPGEPIPAGIV